MPLELTGVLLGLGSIVRLDGESAAGLFVVLARGVHRPDSESPEVVPRYLVGPHPYGEAPDRETFPILAKDVMEVVHEGYADAADAVFLDELLDQAENGRRKITPAHHYEEALTAIPEGTAARADNDDSARASGDPFFELRRLIDQISEG